MNTVSYLLLATLCTLAACAPAVSDFPYYDYLQTNPQDYNFPLNDNYLAMSLEDEIAGRTVPLRKRPNRNNYNSPIYYIRLPPQPFVYVPGLGYISQPPPPPSPVSPFVNLPVSFVTNGKPSTIYQWAGGVGDFPQEPIAPPKPATVSPPVDSTVHKVPGKFTFNGKPEDILVLRDSYNSLYGDALQNFYP